MTDTATGIAQHAVRDRFNAVFFRALGPVLERALRRHKQRVFTDLPDAVVEIGPGVGANLPWVPPGGTLIAIEPNHAMHAPLRAAARRARVRLELRDGVGERTGLPDRSVDVVISSLVLCTVADPAVVLAEIRRILRPGGTFRFVEHVVARRGTPTRLAQRILRRPWAWTFEGCSCERDLELAVRAAGFASVSVHRYRIHSLFLPFNPQIAGIARV
ncbi:methyltransferase [Tersicoccus solisilvae]|uniref:Methyltransferase n=1 Tax=Tersicoccus solisilvae TaxID=1882339 RepID=A0ABQ1PDT9_9MICC|nr:class I SAM-dependent methyltransferase [Tersicoccus solisilvae]GGC95259.1 methyltransferase [Tersicoccus solisilvae]